MDIVREIETGSVANVRGVALNMVSHTEEMHLDLRDPVDLVRVASRSVAEVPRHDMFMRTL